MSAGWVALCVLSGVQDDVQKNRASLLRAALKPHAEFRGLDAAGRVRLHADGETAEKAWAVDPDAEIRVRGFWGRLEDLAPGERVWAWIRVGRDGKPRALFMLADEISEQDIHQVPWILQAREAGKAVVRRKLDGKTEQTRTLRFSAGAGLPPEGSVYLRTAGDEILTAVDEQGLSRLKETQKARMVERWTSEGLPGTVTGLHLLSGEIELSLDHEAMRWGRALQAGDRVTLSLDPPLKAAVQDVRPWYERTRVTLVSSGRDLADVALGARARLSVPAPAVDSRFPPDAERPREAGARVEWMLASTYCGCSIAGDVCTGMFYTLAACNTMTCGMPNRVRAFARPLVEKGLADREIFEKMEAEFGASIWKPHLLR